MLFRRVSAGVVMVLVLGLVQVAATTTPAEAARKYTPRAGVTFNNPVGSGATSRRIYRKILKTIRATPRGQEIRIATWNLQSASATDRLLAAQRRGVKVQLLMSRTNLVEGSPSFERLRAGLRRGNEGRPRDRRSWARVCRLSCRGSSGAAHAKFYLFSRAGRAHHVVIQGSANLTLASTTNQWNDIVTSVNRERPYRFMARIFGQMSKDRPHRPTYAEWSGGSDRLAFFPKGAGVDPVMRMLNNVKCRGAANTRSGRTRLRILPDVLRQERGMALGRKVRRLWRDGCDVRIGYTVVGRDVGLMLRKPSKRGPVPMRHMVQDRDGDGQFDNYFHMKSMSIVGNYGGDRSTKIVLNGAANWSSTSARSDENFGIYRRNRVTDQYEEHFAYWYARAAGWGRSTARVTDDAAARGRVTDEGLLLGTAPIDGVDPYAHVDMD